MGPRSWSRFVRRFGSTLLWVALISILLVFAQMEREAVGERTREAIQHIRRSGYHFGKVPISKRAVRAPDNPRMKVLVDDDAEQSIIAQFSEWAAAGIGVSEMANRLNAAGIRSRGKGRAGPSTPSTTCAYG